MITFINSSLKRDMLKSDQIREIPRFYYLKLHFLGKIQKREYNTVPMPSNIYTILNPSEYFASGFLVKNFGNFILLQIKPNITKPAPITSVTYCQYSLKKFSINSITCPSNISCNTHSAFHSQTYN